MKHRTWETIDIRTGEKRFVPHTDKTLFTIYSYVYPEGGHEWYGAFTGGGLIGDSEDAYNPSECVNWLIEHGVPPSQINRGEIVCPSGCDEIFYDTWLYCPLCGEDLILRCDTLAI